MNVTVSIPVEMGGYTGQREQWESHTHDYKVILEDDGRVKLESPGYGGRSVWFDLNELKTAIAFLQAQGAEERTGG